jgi:hypothetical protein
VQAASSLTIGEAAEVREGIDLLCRSRDLICDITRARVPMPKSTAEFIGCAFRPPCRQVKNDEALV